MAACDRVQLNTSLAEWRAAGCLRLPLTRLPDGLALLRLLRAVVIFVFIHVTCT